MDKQQIMRTYSPLTLAYEGDAVYEVYVRTYLLSLGNEPVNALHRKAKDFVSASAQSAFMEFLEPVLTETEAEIYRRGRNAKSHSHPKNADVAEYRRATGFECIFGFLHLCGDTEREAQLFEYILQHGAN